MKNEQIKKKKKWLHYSDLILELNDIEWWLLTGFFIIIIIINYWTYQSWYPL
jgi:hypothetical protein